MHTAKEIPVKNPNASVLVLLCWGRGIWQTDSKIYIGANETQSKQKEENKEKLSRNQLKKKKRERENNR